MFIISDTFESPLKCPVFVLANWPVLGHTLKLVEKLMACDRPLLLSSAYMEQMNRKIILQHLWWLGGLNKK